MLDAHVVLGRDYGAFWTSRPTLLLPVFVGGWNEVERGYFFEYMAEQRFFESPVYHAFAGLPGPVRVRSRRGLHPGRTWHRSADFNECHRRSGLDEYVLSFWTDPENPEGLTDVLSVHRATGERPFSRQAVRLVGLLHSALGPMISRQLAPAADPSPSDLSPRVRQVLECLLEGDGEKQIAARLGLSRATVSEYVGRIYRHFGVSSRPELMARWVRFAKPQRHSDNA